VSSMLLAGILIGINYNALLWWLSSIDSTALISQNLHLFSSIIIALAASYMLESSERTQFLQRMLLELRQKELEAANGYLQKMTVEDGLTKIANRRYFDQTFAEEWRRGLRSRFPMTLMMVDIDCFKSFNDFYGHQAGDKAIQKVAVILNGFAKRPGDIVARYGGEGFVVVLSGTPLEYGTRVAVKMCRAIEDLAIPHEKSAASPFLTVSIGISSAVADVTAEPEDLLAAADVALYQAKNNGRNQVAVRHYIHAASGEYKDPLAVQSPSGQS